MVISSDYPLVNVYIIMEHHHFQWVNQLFLWSCSIVFCIYVSQKVDDWVKLSWCSWAWFTLIHWCSLLWIAMVYAQSLATVRMGWVDWWMVGTSWWDLFLLQLLGWLEVGGWKDDGIELRAFLLLSSHEYNAIYAYVYIYIYIYLLIYIIWWSMLLLIAETRDPATYPTKVYSSSGSGWWGTKDWQIITMVSTCFQFIVVFFWLGTSFVGLHFGWWSWVRIRKLTWRGRDGYCARCR